MKPESIKFDSRRSAVISKRGVVATSQPLAVAAGLEILRQGGNAADAAVATNAALNVCEPTTSGIGGDCFVLYYDSLAQRVTALNGSGRAPQALTLERLAKEGFGAELPLFHAHTVTVPGACAAWCDLLERHGRLSIAQVLAPAINMAETGFPVAPLTAYFWGRGVERQLRHAINGFELTSEGRAPQPGEIFCNPGLARTFRKVAEGGKAAFYQGEIAEAITNVLKQAGGCMQMEDLAGHHSTWETPIYADYRGVRVWECPPNGQGLAALIGLNILEGFEIGKTAAQSAQRLHLMIEAMRLAFADTRWFVADPVTNPAPLARLLSKEYAAQRRSLIDPLRATLDFQTGAPLAGSNTVYLSVVDSQGNACSLINSNYMGFGTGIVPKGWGFTLQNRGHNFSLDAQHPNALAPGKRPYNTIIPAMMTRSSDRGEELVASYGVMGGFMQPQGHLQVAVSLLDDELDPQASLDQPRFCIEDGTAGGKVALEEGLPVETLESLAQMGHPVTRVSGYGRSLFGRGQVIWRDAHNGVLWAGSDPRADGCAMSE